LIFNNVAFWILGHWERPMGGSGQWVEEADGWEQLMRESGQNEEPKAW